LVAPYRYVYPLPFLSSFPQRASARVLPRSMTLMDRTVKDRVGPEKTSSRQLVNRGYPSPYIPRRTDSHGLLRLMSQTRWRAA
jgi:hypothetical protein